MQRNHVLIHRLTMLVIMLALISTSVGLFYSTGGTPMEVMNQYGDPIRLYGDGIYARDSYFRAPIFKGTDLAILLILVPALIYTLIRDVRKPTVLTRLMLASFLGVSLYYASAVAFGVQYNPLHLVYIGLFSTSLFGLIASLTSISIPRLEAKMAAMPVIHGVPAFLIITGLALGLAWLPDILGAMLAGTSLKLIEHYTTEVTYVLDLGVIIPLCFAGFYYLRSKKGPGYIIISLIMTLCAVIGVILPLQTVFQMAAGIQIPLPVMITKIASFLILAVFATFFQYQLIRQLRQFNDMEI